MASRQEENAALIEEFLTGVIAGADTDALDIFLTESPDNQHPGNEYKADSNPTGSTYWNAIAAADIDISIADIVASAENVAVRGTVTGSHQPVGGNHVSSVGPVEISIAWFCRIENGRIERTCSIPTRQWLIRQLNALPSNR